MPILAAIQFGWNGMCQIAGLLQDIKYTEFAICSSDNCAFCPEKEDADSVFVEKIDSDKKSD